MSEEKAVLKGPDLTQGVELSGIPDGGMLLGHALGEPVLLARRGDELFAIGAICTHYGAPLETGLLVGDTVRCPWHHACFSLRTGEALRAPALPPVACWRVSEVRDAARQFTPLEQRVGAVYVSEKLERIAPRVQPARTGSPEPCDRPNLSKGYLAGAASEASNFLRSTKFYADHAIDVRLKTRVAAIDTGSGHLELADGERLAYGALLLATGADPVRLAVPGGDLPHVHYLRTLADSRALVAKALTSRRAVVIGASFIGLEVAASLRARNVEVQVVAPEKVPMEKVLGPQLGNFIRRLHESHGVIFHLGATAVSIDERSVSLNNGATLDADLVVIGIGVRPAISLAQKAGLAIDRGVTVDEYLQTSAPGIFAAGDIARWPDRLTGERIRIEHFVVAERQGQTAARNILGARERFAAVPFFWTEQYDLGVAYVGHAEHWDELEIDGQLEARDCIVTYRRAGKKLAVAVIHRDLAGLRAEVHFERAIARTDGGSHDECATDLTPARAAASASHQGV